MNIKNNMDYIKNELSNEEKIFENFVKIEQFLKKYKKTLLVLIIVLILGSLGVFITNKINKASLYEANIALNDFLEKNDQNALETLKKKNTQLYELALYLEAKKDLKEANISIPYLKELLNFQLAVANSNQELLDNVSKNSNFLLKDYAIFNRALLLTNEQKYSEAKTLLQEITKESKAYDLALLLKHYLVTK